MPAKLRISAKRDQINKIDEKVLALLNRRAEISLDIREIKREAGMDIYDEAREEEVVKRLCKKNKGPMNDENIRDLFKQIMKTMRELPDKN